MARLPELEGKILCRWCPGKNGAPTVLTLADDEICHGQVLLRLLAEQLK